MPCLHAISSLLEKDKKQRIGAASFESFCDNPFFRVIDFEALERKEIEPVFKPSSEKTNFDATYDLEELLLEEAPLEARARRQKPREQLKADATEQEIRADELHKMIETLFEPFNYMAVAAERPALEVTEEAPTSNHTPTSANSPTSEWPRPVSQQKTPVENGEGLQINTTKQNRSATHSPSGSPPGNAATTPTSAPSTRTSRVDKEREKEKQRKERREARRDRERQENAEYFGPSSTASESAASPPSYSRPINPRKHGSTRSTSMGGGVQVVLNETGSWSEMANQSSAMLQKPDDRQERPSGMLGFFSRKKGRDRSPKAKERGVLGKEGARVIISNT
jgi:serine/threonine kinase 32